MTDGPGAPLRPPAPRWILRPGPDRGDARRLAEATRLPEPLCAVLVQRGHGTPPAARAHLRPLADHLPDPTRIRDLARAAARIRDAIDVGEPIFVHGDYDVDGVCATALLTHWLRRLGAVVHPFVPHRIRDGYDLTVAGVDRAREAGAGVLVTVDCGIVAHEAVRHAVESGLDVIVTDHHTPSDSLPPAHAVVNPNRVDDDSGYGMLCGAGVAFALVSHLASAAGHPRESLLPDLDLVALATVADLVPLEGPNRAMVRIGLRALGRTSRVGLRALLEVCELATPSDVVHEAPAVPEGRVGFVLAPRINAVGRMGDAGDALRLLLTDSRDEARELARRLDDLNRSRREEDRRTLDEALELLARRWNPEEDFGVVLAGEGWHPGVIGIVASRVVERIHRPVVLVAMDGERGRGSARSIPGFHLHDAIGEVSDRLVRFGGHAQAAGLEVERGRLEDFRSGFADIARRRLADVDLRPQIRIDLELDPADADLELADRAQWLGPHGIGNPRPVFLSRDVRVREAREVGTGHLKLRLDAGGSTVEAIGFGLVDRHPPADLTDRRVDVVYQLTVNEWRGRRSAQMKLLDLRPAGGEVEVAS
ncbi:MAG TPA: single-stranded-DNA-specific exonuclease RecJ [Longimicrobiales bacterium]|nr:single-stranded-DNA-specific exonuclease RecJ [Longimicrobiales bacterium]